MSHDENRAVPNPAAAALPDADRLRAALSGTRWTRIEVVPETGSTNADLIERADADGGTGSGGTGSDGVDGTVRIAGFQSSGRGRHSRVWQTPHGQLAVSAAVAVGPGDTERIGWLSLLTGLAVRDAIAQVSGVRPELKWPNDVLAPKGGKLSGILAEFRPLPAGGGVAVIGTGINLDLDSVADGAEAASVRGLAGTEVDSTQLAVAYLRALSERLAHWPHDVDGLVADYRAASATIGRRVRLILPGDAEVIGDAVGIDEQGAIVVQGPDERIVASAGDVTHLRPVE
ncbi:biotin--[acetyl-CoA-carboxylase] ligase [Gordonia zhaorongruii]|uniref:biotin--[acetyl-CoA-carboxylase] ligase n=1 Tax=Gordonia zhaorongruii TaxID=2597659 RepID=UPI001F2A946F|nr:biotin--[acetyl-CoA-carboxylase] ligase [Gordonia zhaorongruii]